MRNYDYYNNNINQNNLAIIEDLRKQNDNYKSKYNNMKNDYLSLKEENEKYKIENPQLLKEIKKLENIQKDLKEKNKNYANIIDNNQNEIRTLKKTNKQYEFEKNDLLRKIKEMELKIKQLNDKIIKDNEENEKTKNEIEKEYKDKSKRFEGALNQFDKLTKENEELRSKIIELNNVLKENKSLVKQNKNLLKNMGFREEYYNEKMKDYYDVIIEIDSINKLFKSGWKINYNEKRKEIYERIIKEETIKIGVLGINNVGKSFILGLITGLPIPTGYSIETKGISIKYSEGEVNPDEGSKIDKGICLLDSAGFETPLLNEEVLENEEIKNEKNIKEDADKNLNYMDKLNDIAKDKQQTERFIEELIISLSDMLILVIGKLTRKEQNLISRIKTLVNQKENIQFKSLIIIHNLAQYNEIEEVENHINNVLRKSATFDLKETDVRGIPEYENRIFYIEKDGTDHYIMARQDSPAGKYYNKLTIQLIKQKYNNCKSRRKIDIPKEITNLFSTLSKDITEDEITIENLEISNDEKKITVKTEKTKNDKIKCQQCYLDEMGNYNSISSKYVPKCSYYVYREKSKETNKFNNYLLIRLEIPGKIDNLTASFCYYGRKKTILFKGHKSKDDFPEMKKQSFIQIKDNRNYEDFRYYLEIDKDIEFMYETPLGKTDIYEFEFNRNNIEISNIKEENDENEEEEAQDQETIKEDEKLKIASGVYMMKFMINETSMKILSKKYKRVLK